MTAPTPADSPGGRSRKPAVVLLAAGIAVVLAVVVIVAVRLSGGGDPAQAQAGAGPATGGSSSRPAATTTTSPPVTVSSISPAAGSKGVAADAALTVTYSGPLTATPPTPVLDPPVAGAWTHHGAVLSFTPSGGWLPYGTEKVTVPPIAGGAPAGTSFTVQAGDRNRLEQLLAELNYLPFTFKPTAPLPSGATSALAAEPAVADAVPTSPVPGALAWSWPTVPPTLSALWAPGKVNVLDQGAVMAFQSDHGMKMDGIAGPQVWAALVTAVAGRQLDKNPYDYLVASEKLPETLTVYRAGQVIYTTRANTGVSGATTQPGTFPVYSRFSSTTMHGTNPDGTKYDDKGIPWVAYFNGGDAVHGFVRHSYGFPQSNGCVELPVANAAQVWTMDPYGTLVTVTA